MNMKEIKVGVSSNIDYIDKTYNRCVGSLLKTSINADDIHVFVGGYKNYNRYINEDGVNIYEIPFSSFEYNSYISIIEYEIYSDFWFLTHDTTYYDSHFYDTLKSYIELNDVINVRLYNGNPSNNMGLYSYKFLLSNKNKILQFRNTDFDEETLVSLKRKIVEKEDMLLSNKQYLNGDMRVEMDVKEFESDLLKRIEHFDELGLHKVKTNYSGLNNLKTRL